MEELKRLTALRLANELSHGATDQEQAQAAYDYDCDDEYAYDYAMPQQQPTAIQSEFVARAWVVAHEYFSYRCDMGQKENRLQQPWELQMENESNLTP